MTTIEIKSTTRVFSGHLVRFSHQSHETKTGMTAAIFLPDNAVSRKDDASLKIPVIYYLSGLTCTDENVCQKGSPFRALAAHKAIPPLSPLLIMSFLSIDCFHRSRYIPAWCKHSRRE
jgi:S-formylglutathione hydrolase